MLARTSRHVCLRHLGCARSSGTLGRCSAARADFPCARPPGNQASVLRCCWTALSCSPPKFARCLPAACIEPRLSPDSLEAYLMFGSVAEPSTLVEGVFSVPPGHFLTFAADAPPAKPSPKPYWDFSDAVLHAGRAAAEKFAGSGKTVAPVARRNRSRSPDRRCSAGRIPFERPGFHRLVALGQPLPERSAHVYGRVSRAAFQRSQNFARNGQAFQDAS